MRSVTIFASALAFAASALAQAPTDGYAAMSAPGDGQVIPSGKSFTIKWSAGKYTGPATISLLAGNTPETLEVVNDIGAGVEVKAGSFDWAVDCSLGQDKTYGIKIADVATSGARFQYSFPFHIKGPSCGSDSESSSSASASSTSSVAGYPTKGQTETASHTKPAGYPVETSTSAVATTSSSSSSSSAPVTTSSSSSSSTPVHSTSIIVSSSIYSNHTTTVKSSTSSKLATTTLATQTTPIVYVTETSGVAVSTSSSAVPTSSTTAIPTAGAARTGAGIALGLIAAALAI
ncbi:Ser-Thr-rich glycosyl-phosphatidyl-inositol-anchored membrane family-domain-containing protein [Astrocystis sublimbata]|nr:Ser-Thr-rich glycosyl-phosphatidyl-inositol-anchored membrane family-domain-containing protein [Astrocystis sublimbata]